MSISRHPLRILCILPLLLFSSVSEARTYEEIEKSGTLEIATEGAFPPFNFIKDGKLQGFEIDLVNEMAKRLNLKTKWQTMKFETLLMGLFQDHYDLVAASEAMNAGRENAVDFLPPHYCSGGQIVALTGGPKKLAELKDKNVAAQTGSIYPAFLEKNAQVKTIRTFSTEPQMLQALIQHQVDAALTDRFMVKQFTKGHAELQTGDMVNPEKDAMAVKKGNALLLKKLTGALNSILKDGTYAKISRMYFGEDIRCKKN